MRIRCLSADAVTDAVSGGLERLLAELDPARPPQPANIAALLADPSARLLVAQEEEEVIGMLTLTFRNSLTRRSAHIDHVVVSPGRRRAGVATALVEEALRLAAAERATRVDLSSSPDRVAAQALYRALRFEQRRTVQWRRLL